MIVRDRMIKYARLVLRRVNFSKLIVFTVLEKSKTDTGLSDETYLD